LPFKNNIQLSHAGTSFTGAHSLEGVFNKLPDDLSEILKKNSEPLRDGDFIQLC